VYPYFCAILNGVHAPVSPTSDIVSLVCMLESHVGNFSRFLILSCLFHQTAGAEYPIDDPLEWHLLGGHI
jgi:hypothetical protein